MANPNPSPATRFKKGYDARRYIKQADPFRAAIQKYAEAHPEDVDDVVRVAWARARAGSAADRQWLADRGFDKAINRSESGQPGEFDKLDIRFEVIDGRDDGQAAG